MISQKRIATFYLLAAICMILLLPNQLLEANNHINALQSEPPTISSVAWSPNGSFIAAGDVNGNVRILDSNSGNILKTFSGYTGEVLSLAWKPDESQIATGDTDGVIRIWDISSALPIQILQLPTGKEVLSLAWSFDSTLLASAADDRAVRIWNTTTWQAIEAYSHYWRAIGVAWTRDSSYLASVSVDGEIIIWTRSNQQRTTLDNGASLTSVSWSPNGTLLVTGDMRNNIKVWDIASGTVTQTLSGHTDMVLSVAWSPGGSQIASSSFDNTIRVWDIATGETVEVQTIVPFAGSTIVTWSPDGSKLAYGQPDGAVSIVPAPAVSSPILFASNRDGNWELPSDTTDYGLNGETKT